MKEYIATISSSGQVTIPAEIRKHLCITSNEQIVFVIDDDGVVRLRRPRYPTIISLRGAAGKLEKPLPWPEVRQIASEDRLKNNRELL